MRPFNDIFGEIVDIAVRKDVAALNALLATGIPVDFCANQCTPALACVQEAKFAAATFLLSVENAYDDKSSLIQQAWTMATEEAISWLIDCVNSEIITVAQVINAMPEELECLINLLCLAAEQPCFAQILETTLPNLDTDQEQQSLALAAKTISLYVHKYQLSLTHAKRCTMWHDDLQILENTVLTGDTTKLTSIAEQLAQSEDSTFLLKHDGVIDHLFYLACSTGQPQRVQAVSAAWQCPFSIRPDAWEALYIAAQHNHQELVTWLLNDNDELIAELSQHQPDYGRSITHKTIKDQLIEAECHYLLRTLDESHNNSSLPASPDELTQPRAKRTKHTAKTLTHLNGLERDINVVSDIVKHYNVHHKYLGRPPLPSMFISSRKDAASVAPNWRTFDFVRPEKSKTHVPCKVTTLKSDYLRGDYYSVRDHLVQNNERFTVVFAKRLTKAYAPPEQAGGRVCFILSAEEEKSAASCVSEFCDVFVIKHLATQAQGPDGNAIHEIVSEEDLSLIMSRRLAAFLLAKHCQRKDLMVIDDNITQFAFNPHSHPADTPFNWASIYTYFAQFAKAKEFTCLSTRSLRPEFELAAEEILTDPRQHLGSKSFYLDFEKIQQQFPTEGELTTLLTQHRRSWGSDVFFQLMLMFSGKIGVLSYQTAILTRAMDNKNAALKTLEPAAKWLDRQNKEFLPGRQRQVCMVMQKIIKLSLQRYEQRAVKFKYIDLKNEHAVNNNCPVEKQHSLTPQTRVKMNCAKSWAIPESDLALLNQSHLRPYQIEAVREMSAAIGTVGTMESPPRTGKTTMMLAQLALLLKQNTQQHGNIVLISPQINLVKQLYNDIIEYNAAAPMLPINIYDVIKVSSHDTDISTAYLMINEPLKKQNNLFIFCADSFRLMLEHYPDFINSISFSFVDEAHKTPTSILRHLSDHANKTKTTAIAVSATLGKAAAIYGNKAIYTLSVAQAHQQGIIRQWVLDKLNVDYSRKNVSDLVLAFPDILKHHHTPDGRLLKDRKLLVFVPRINTANKFIAALDKAGIPSFAIHSQMKNQKATDGTVLNQQALLAKFSDKNSGYNIMFVVQMYSYGKTLENCDAVAYFKAGNSDDLFQAVARSFQKANFNQTSNATTTPAYILLLQNANTEKLKQDSAVLSNHTFDATYQEKTQQFCVDDNDQTHIVTGSQPPPEKSKRSYTITPYLPTHSSVPMLIEDEYMDSLTSENDSDSDDANDSSPHWKDCVINEYLNPHTGHSQSGTISDEDEIMQSVAALYHYEKFAQQTLFYSAPVISSNHKQLSIIQNTPHTTQQNPSRRN